MDKTSIILLAAGESRRFKQACGRHKLLEPLPDSDLCLFEMSVQNVQLTGQPVTVVLQPADRQLQRMCHRAGVNYISVASQDMGASIAAGVRATFNRVGWMIALADMPFISQETFSTVLQAVQQGNIARPVYGKECGHPVGFPASLEPRLRALKGEEGARSILADSPWIRLESNDAGCLWDIDLPGQLITGKGIE